MTGPVFISNRWEFLAFCLPAALRIELKGKAFSWKYLFDAVSDTHSKKRKSPEREDLDPHP